MKKHYNITHLTDELSNSVFFQKPEQPEEPEEKNQRTQETKQQSTVARKHFSSI